MIEGRQGTAIKKMVQGQLKTETEVRVTRENGQHFDLAKYVFAGGFQIVATKHGVTFAGSCTSLKTEQLKRFKIFVNRAMRIYQELEAGRGLIPEEEFTELRLRGRKEGDLHVAWYEGLKNTNVQHTDSATAVRQLRINRIALHGAKS